MGSADPISPVHITLAMPTNTPPMTCAPMRVGIEGIPLTNAARAFAPISRTSQRNGVRESIVHRTNVARGTWRMGEEIEEAGPQVREPFRCRAAGLGHGHGVRALEYYVECTCHHHGADAQYGDRRSRCRLERHPHARCKQCCVGPAIGSTDAAIRRGTVIRLGCSPAAHQRQQSSFGNFGPCLRTAGTPVTERSGTFADGSAFVNAVGNDQNTDAGGPQLANHLENRATPE